MNVRLAIVVMAIVVVILWGTAFFQTFSRGKLDFASEEPRCKERLVADELKGMKRIVECREE